MRRRIKLFVGLFLLVVFSSFVSADLGDDLEWCFDWDSDNTFSSSVNGYFGTNTLTTNTTALLGDGARLVDVLNSEYISINYTTLPENFTISYLYNPTNDGSWRHVFAKGMAYDNSDFYFYCTNTNEWSLRLDDGTQDSGTAGTCTAGNTYHIIIIKEGLDWTYYIDGVQTGSKTEDGTLVDTGQNFYVNAPFSIGQDGRGTHDVYKMWFRNLTSSEIAEDYNTGSYTSCSDIAPPPVVVANNDSIESTAVVKQTGSVTLTGPNPQTIFSSDYNVSVNSTDIYGGYSFNVLSNFDNEIFCELSIDGSVVANVTRSNDNGVLGSVWVQSTFFTQDEGLHNQSLVCQRNGAGNIVVSNAIGIGHFMKDFENRTIPHNESMVSKVVTSGSSWTQIGDFNVTVSNLSNDALIHNLIVEGSLSYANNGGSAELLSSYVSINNSFNCSFVPRYVGSGGTGSVSSDCLLENVSINQTYNVKIYGNGTNSEYVGNFVGKVMFMSDEEIAGGVGALVGLNWSGDGDVKLVNITGGNLNHASANVFQKVAWAIKTNESTTVTGYVRLANGFNVSTVNFTRSFNPDEVGVIIGHDSFESVAQDNYTLEVWVNCGSSSAFCEMVGGSSLGYITDNVPTVVNAFNISVFDNYDNLSISTFVVTDGATFNTSNGWLLYFTEEDFENLTVSSNDYFSGVVLNHNTSVDLNVYLNQTLITWDCFEKVSGSNLNCSNPSESKVFNYNVVGNPHSQSLNVSGYFERVISFNVSALQNNTLNASGFYSSLVNYTSIAQVGGSTGNCSFNTTSLSYPSFEQIDNTSNGSVIGVGLINGTYSVVVDCDNFAITRQNITVDENYESFNFFMFTTNSINISFYDSDTGLLLNGTNITVQFIGDTKQSNITNTGFLYVDLLSPDEYSIISDAVGYRQSSYIITLLNRSTQNISIFLQKENNSELVLVTVRDRVSSIRIAGAKVIIQRYNNDAWFTDQILKTDFQGNSEAHFVISTVFYNFLVEVNGIIFFGILNGDENKKNIYAEDVTNGLIIQIDTNPNNVVADFQDLYSVSTSINNTVLSNVSARFRFSWNDVTGSDHVGVLKVYKDGVLFDTQTSTTSNGVLFSVVTVNESDGLVGFTAVGSVDGENKGTSSIIIGVDEVFSLAWGVFGYFLGFLILVILAFGFADNPSLSVAFSSLAFIGMIIAQIIFKDIDIVVWSFILVAGVFVARIPKKIGGV